MNIMPDEFYNKISSTLLDDNYSLTEPKELVEWNVDTETGEFIINENGTIDKVYDLDALKVRVWLKLSTYRGRYFIFSKDYGNRLKDYIGQISGELRRMAEFDLKKCLVDDEYITDIQDVSVDDSDNEFILTFVIVNIFNNYKYTTKITK